MRRMELKDRSIHFILFGVSKYLLQKSVKPENDSNSLWFSHKAEEIILSFGALTTSLPSLVLLGLMNGRPKTDNKIMAPRRPAEWRHVVSKN